MTKKFTKVILVLLSVYFIGCNEQPTELGYQIDSVSFQAISSQELDLVLGSASQRYYLTPFNQGVFQVGTNQEYSAYPILRYDNIAFLDSAESIISAKLKLIKSGYALGDTTALQSFEIFEVKVPVLPTSTYETVIEENGLENIYEGQVMGQLESPYNMIDDTTYIDLDLQLIQNWINFSVLEATNAIDSNDFRRQHSYSIGLRPTENSQVINGFLSERIGSTTESPNPLIEIIYKWPDSTDNDTLLLKANVASYYANAPEPSDNSLTVQSAINIRSKLDFDVSSLPEYASVVKAVLKVYVNDEESYYGSFGRDSFLLAQKDVSFEDGFFESIDNIYLGLRSEGNDYYRFTSITSAVEDWVRGDGKGSLMFYYAPNTNPSDTYFRLDKYALYGTETEEALRPELTIFYAKRPEF